MAITAAVCNSFKNELLAMTPHTAADTYKIALYTSSATLSAATTAYSATNEVAASGTYAAGGAALAGFTVADYSGTAVLDFTTDPSWTGATLSAAGALIYNSTRANKAVAVLDFGGTITSTNGTFTVALPAPGASTGLIRLA